MTRRSLAAHSSRTPSGWFFADDYGGGRLVRTPIVDRNGYSFVLERADGSLVIDRRARLSHERCDDDKVDGDQDGREWEAHKKSTRDRDDDAHDDRGCSEAEIERLL